MGDGTGRRDVGACTPQFVCGERRRQHMDAGVTERLPVRVVDTEAVDRITAEHRRCVIVDDERQRRVPLRHHGPTQVDEAPHRLMLRRRGNAVERYVVEEQDRIHVLLVHHVAIHRPFAARAQTREPMDGTGGPNATTPRVGGIDPAQQHTHGRF